MSSVAEAQTYFRDVCPVVLELASEDDLAAFAARESATVLDRCIRQEGGDLRPGAARYDAEWGPEADAVSWIAQRVRFDDLLNMLRSVAGPSDVRASRLSRPSTT